MAPPARPSSAAPARRPAMSASTSRSAMASSDGAGPSASRVPASRSNGPPLNARAAGASSSHSEEGQAGGRPRAGSVAVASTAMGRRRDEDETNIQVVVRVRGRAPGESAPKEPIVSTSGPRCQAISIALDAPVVSSSSAAASALAEPTAVREKTYDFDHVFGPEADQGMVYQHVVGPILDEVLSGYNCTIFAYGQTGTGKTHTMEGDLSSQLGGTYASEAGIIPRTLYRLFHTLELQRYEYSVHATFVELYNEELRDLLSADLPTPLGGAKDSGLKLFESDGEKGRRGVFIEGVSDSPIIDAADGLKLLRRGSQKRQIAATRCNESSSRSHSVFTLTVHIKETTPKGEDVMRTGKLNLVDLAGSENIGRSGAENKRAREAGMINQSLLTLGRVINALVEKSTHIPYRESKLTRLLKESLGGRTKTCIIATVSTEKDSMEETLSTLDYALRAKSIKNRPELNRRMTRAGLIKDYVHEIGTLKRDLIAAREKDGFYVSSDSWKAMHDEHEGTKTEADELRRGKEVAESKMNSLREQFEQNMQLLTKRDGEAKAAKAEFVEQSETLRQINLRVEELLVAEEEERTLREAYQRSERKLSSVSDALNVLVGESTKDLGGLFGKLERKEKVEMANRALAAECQQSVSSMTGALEARVLEYRSSHDRFTSDLSAQLSKFAQRQGADAEAKGQHLEERTRDLAKLSATLRSKQELSVEQSAKAADELDRIREAVISASEERRAAQSDSCSRLASQLLESSRSSAERMKSGLAAIIEITGDIAQAAQNHVTDSATRIQAVQDLAQARTSQELQALREQNELLIQLLDDERAKARTMRDELAANISRLLVGFTDDRDRSLTEAVGSVQARLTAEQQSAQAFAASHGALVTEVAESSSAFATDIAQREKIARKHRRKCDATIDQSCERTAQSIETFGSEIGEIAEQDVAQTQQMGKSFAERLARLRNDAAGTQQAQEADLTELTSSVSASYATMRTALSKSQKAVDSYSAKASSSIAEHKSSGLAFAATAAQQLADLREESRGYLSSRFAVDEPTGDTPRKREWTAPAPWRLVPSDRLKAIQQQRMRVEAAEQQGVTSVSIACSESDAGDAGEELDDEQVAISSPLLSDDTLMPGERTARRSDSHSSLSSAAEAAEPEKVANAPLRQLSNGNTAAALPKRKAADADAAGPEKPLLRASAVPSMIGRPKRVRP